MKSIGRDAASLNRGMCLACFDDDYPSPLVDKEAAETAPGII